jgi:hypothetical protein
MVMVMVTVMVMVMSPTQVLLPVVVSRVGMKVLGP